MIHFLSLLLIVCENPLIIFIVYKLDYLSISQIKGKTFVACSLTFILKDDPGYFWPPR